MRVNVSGLGYREIYRLAEFMMIIADNGISGDVAETFGYNLAVDEAFVETENGSVIWANEDF